MVFWSVMDMVLLGGSLAIVLMPLHHRLSAPGQAAISLQHSLPALFFLLLPVAALDHPPDPHGKCRYPDRHVYHHRDLAQ